MSSSISIPSISSMLLGVVTSVIIISSTIPHPATAFTTTSSPLSSPLVHLSSQQHSSTSSSPIRRHAFVPKSLPHCCITHNNRVVVVNLQKDDESIFSSNTHDNNINNIDNISSSSSRKRKRVVAFFRTMGRSIMFLLIPMMGTTAVHVPNAYAVIGSIPKRPQTSRVREEDLMLKNKSSSNKIRPPDFSDPMYQGKTGERLKELHMKMYQTQLEEQKRLGIDNNSKDDDSSVTAIRPGEQRHLMDDDKSNAMLSQLQALQKSAPTTTTTTTNTAPKVSIAPKTKSMKKIRTPKQRARQITVTTLKFSGFLTAGFFFAKQQNSEEQRRVEKGIEIYESQKAEFFNVTGKADSDADLADELKQFNQTSTDEDDDDDDDDDDVVKPKKSGPKKPSGGGGGGGTPPTMGGSGGTTPPKKTTGSTEDNSKASDDDIERMKRLFNK